MSPITFACTQVIPKTAAEICAEIANLSRWPEFSGYGVLPGIKHAEYEARPDDMIGARIQVQNTDGSRHVEEILVWHTGEHIVMKLHEFTGPLSNLASHFTEEWTFVPDTSGTHVTRQFELHPKYPATRPMLWLISLLFRRAVAHHLRQMAHA